MYSALLTRNAELGSERSPDPTTIMVWNNMPAFRPSSYG
jgi:hypothetical protein